MRIALLAKGPTLKKYPGKEGYDEVWGLNQLGCSHDLDKLFIMDDLVYRMPAWDPDLPEFLKTYDKPFITSKKYDDWPMAEEYPIREVCHEFGVPLGMAMYSTVDYMLAYGIYLGVEQMDLYGVDCSNPKREERVRVSIAMWIGVAQSRGIRVTTQPGSFYQWYTVPGVCYEEGLYGYCSPPRIEELRAPEVRTRLEREGVQNSKQRGTKAPSDAWPSEDSWREAYSFFRDGHWEA